MKPNQMAPRYSSPRPEQRHGRRLVAPLITLLVMAAVALPANGGRSAALAAPAKLTSIKVQLSWLNNVEFAGIYVATANGYFKKYGLSVTTAAGGTTIDPRSVVANGAATIGTVAVGTDEAIAVSQGVDLQAFAAIYQKNPACLMVRANSGIHNAQGLRGKTIGLQNPARDQVKGILNYNHIPLSAVKLQTVGFDPTPFALGKVDAYTAFAFNEPITMRLKGIKVNCLSLSDLGLPSYGDIFIAKRETITSQPGMLAKFTKAVQMGWSYAVAHPQAVTQMVLKNFAKDQDPKQQKAQIGVEIPLLRSAGAKSHGLLWMSPSVWQRSLNFLHNQHMLKRSLKVSDVETQAVLTRVAKLH